MADGCEEIEALTVVDIARRAGIEAAMISITGEKIVKGAHGINFETDIPAEFMDFDMLDGKEVGRSNDATRKRIRNMNASRTARKNRKAK